jgi:hypothetical protein
MDREKIISFLEKYIRIIVTFLFSWISADGEVIAYVLAVLHILMFVMLSTSIFLAHTIYPVFWFQVVTTAILIIVWFQHIFLKVCVVTVAESKLHKIEAPSTPYLSQIFSYILNTDLNSALTTLVIAESVCVMCFSLEIIGKCSAAILYNIPLSQ